MTRGKITGLSVLLAALFLLPLISCCGTKSGQDKKDPSTTLPGTRLAAGELMGRAFLCMEDDRIFMKSFYPDSVGVIYRIEGDSLIQVKHFGIRGRAPYEFQDPYFAYYDDSLYMFNTSGRGELLDLYVASTDDLENDDGYENWKRYDMSWLNPIMPGLSFAPLGDRRFMLIAAGYGEADILSLVDINEKSRKPANYWIADDYKGANIPKQSIYMGNSRLFRKDSLILFAAGEGRYMDILEPGRDGGISVRKNIYAIPPDYVDVGDKLNFGILPTSYRGIRAFATDGCIYAFLTVYTPEYEEYKGYPFYYFDEIEIYDWDGDFVACFATDRPFYDFIVSADDSTLLTITQDMESGEPAVYRYRLGTLR